MLVYRSDEETIDVRVVWSALGRRIAALPERADHDEVTAILIELGELEAAIADRLFEERDGMNAAADALRRASLAAGFLFLASWRSPRATAAAVDVLRRAVAHVPEGQLPDAAAVRVAEGYAYYALHPETYALAAARFAAAVRPSAVVTIGLRSIGTSLSAVVAAEIASRGIPVRLVSVRPRGHPFDREIRLDAALAAEIRAHADRAHFAIVDEGPGLSGSSFASAVEALAREGVPPSRMALFPSWIPGQGVLRSDRARHAWERVRKWSAHASEAGVGIDPVLDGDDAEDWSAGAWRRSMFADDSEWPAVQPQHERVKRKVHRRQEVVRFAGLARYGRDKYSRAHMLAEAGFTTPPRALERGYLRERFVPGPRIRAASPEVLQFLGRYAAFLSRRCPARRAIPLELVQEMIETNCREADGRLRVPALDSHGNALGDAPATALDGRLLPHELIAGEDGPIKTDALDHACDHFFPGTADIAWDLAAVEAEFALDSVASEALIDTFTKAAADGDVRRRLPFYRLAYAAFQLGYATMAMESLGGSQEARRFERRRAGFLERVRALTAR